MRDDALHTESQSSRWKRVDGEQNGVAGHRFSEPEGSNAVPDTDFGETFLAARVRGQAIPFENGGLSFGGFQAQAPQSEMNQNAHACGSGFSVAIREW
jgi:hypothetical protein